MSYHHCPIEPSDWSDGPDDRGICRECEESGYISQSSCGDDEDIECPDCSGSGYIEYEPFDDDVF